MTAVVDHDTAPESAVKIARALISVSDKSSLADFGRALAGFGVEVLSTGGSAQALRDAGVAVKEVAEHTGFPEMLDGRVKTLHPKVHGGILGRRDLPAHVEAMAAHGIAPIDLVVVNLYPFEATVARGADPETCIENIDIGGPALIRAAAKNHAHVAIVTDPADYAAVLDAMRDTGGATPLALRQRLAQAAYAHTAAYDAAIAGWMAGQQGEAFPERWTLAGTRAQTLRYGENPHQQAAFYHRNDETRPGIASAAQVQGKELSYNNLNDADAAFELAAEFAGPDLDKPAVVIVKHANPCGVAMADDLVTAYRRAFACDPVSAFGGIVAVNRSLDAAVAEAITGVFAEVVVAPDASPEARDVLAKKGNLRVLLTGAMPDAAAPGMTVRTLAGGVLLQGRDNRRARLQDLKVVTKRQPTPREMADLLFAAVIAKHVKSNAIVYARDGATVGVGAGQMSRVDAARIAATKAEDVAREAGLEASACVGSVVASDAFFPFADGLLATAQAGATAVIQPGGSMRDEEVIAAADDAGLAMIFTGLRHFRH